MGGCACASALNHFRASCVYSAHMNAISKDSTEMHYISIERMTWNIVSIVWYIICAHTSPANPLILKLFARAYFWLNCEHKNLISHLHVALVYTNTYSWLFSQGKFIAFHLFHILIIAYTFQQRQRRQQQEKTNSFKSPFRTGCLNAHAHSNEAILSIFCMA